MQANNIRPRRSFLFAPGTAPHMFPKAVRAQPDIVCVDLEDAVAPQDKATARAQTIALFTERPAETNSELMIRINSMRSPEGLADVLAILAADGQPDSLMMPKVKTPDEVKLLDDILTEAGVPIRLQVIIETNEGLEAAAEIARASSRMDAVLFGGVDMSADLRVGSSWNALLYARQRLVHAAATAGIDVLDVPHLDLNDFDGLEREALLAKEIGMTGKGLIHPKQLATIMKVFTPSAEAIDRARRIVAAFETANSALVVIDGKLIEKPVLRNMQRILSISERMHTQ
ncbi:MAG: HpcH/HpaI aldolase/citrate lyase family protein [Candidatus Promineifilaceae bacterium]